MVNVLFCFVFSVVVVVMFSLGVFVLLFFLSANFLSFVCLERVHILGREGSSGGETHDQTKQCIKYFK